MFLGGLQANLNEHLPIEEPRTKDSSLDHWFDDEDMEEDSPSLHWRPNVNTINKPTSLIQPQSVHTYDLLARLSSFKVSSNPVKDPRRNSSVKLDMSKPPSASLVPSSHIPGTLSLNIEGGHQRRKSVSAFQRDLNNEVETLGIPFQEKQVAAVPIRPLERTGMEQIDGSKMLSMISGLRKSTKKHKRGKSENLPKINTTLGEPSALLSAPVIENEDDEQTLSIFC